MSASMETVRLRRGREGYIPHGFPGAVSTKENDKTPNPEAKIFADTSLFR